MLLLFRFILLTPVLNFYFYCVILIPFKNVGQEFIATFQQKGFIFSYIECVGTRAVNLCSKCKSLRKGSRQIGRCMASACHKLRVLQHIPHLLLGKNIPQYLPHGFVVHKLHSINQRQTLESLTRIIISPSIFNRFY